MKPGFEIVIENTNALTFTADVLMIKQSARSGGLDAVIRNHLRRHGNNALHKNLDVGASILVPNPPGLNYQAILAVGTVDVFALGYEEVRVLGRNMLASLYDANMPVAHAATTLHGVNTAKALDEVEAFRSLFLGFMDAVEAGTVPPTLKRLTILESEPHRVSLLNENLEKFLPAETSRQISTEETASILTRPLADETTPHVFVAMPFADAFDDQYYLAIRPAITEHNILCIRLDQAESAFTGDIMEQVKERIRTARLVVALLDGSNPNVYLEVGYAWGVGTPTVLILHENETIPFDVQGARLIKYNKIYRLKEQILQELRVLLSER